MVIGSSGWLGSMVRAEKMNRRMRPTSRLSPLLRALINRVAAWCTLRGSRPAMAQTSSKCGDRLPNHSRACLRCHSKSIRSACVLSLRGDANRSRNACKMTARHNLMQSRSSSGSTGRSFRNKFFKIGFIQPPLSHASRLIAGRVRRQLIAELFTLGTIGRQVTKPCHFSR